MTQATNQLLTQDEYQLWTGQSASQYSTTQWDKIVTNASRRLASFLCLDTLPTDEQGHLPEDLEEVLANLINAILALRGRNGDVESKSVRNFTIKYTTTATADAFASIYARFADVISWYSNCTDGLDIERPAFYCCGDFR